MDRCKIKIWLILIAGFVLFYGGLSNCVYANGDNVNMKSHEDLLLLAREIASKYGYDINKYDFYIEEDGDFITVVLRPKPLPNKDLIRIGGGGKLFFKIENGNYKFIKIEFGQ